jgi:hypothetical protein
MSGRRYFALVALVLFAVTLTQAQPSGVGTVAPPVRADMALRGSVLATRNTADHLTCQSECQRTTGCNGYSFDRAAKANCALLGGTLTDVALLGAVSCRMPCVAGAAALKSPVAIVREPSLGGAKLPLATRSTPATASPAPLPPPLLVAPAPVIVGAYKPPPAPKPPPPAATPPAQVASAAGRTGVFGYEVVQGPEVNVAPLGSAVVTAQCPEGKVALSAGFDFSAVGDASYGLEMRGAIPDGRNAQVRVRNANILDAAKARAFAVCVNTIPGLRVVDSTTESLDTVENPSHLACLGRERLVGGGVMAGNDTLINANAPQAWGDPGTWLVTVIRSSPLAGQDAIRTRALCAPDALVDGWQIIETAAVYLTPHSNRMLLQGCPGSKVLLAGGVVRRSGPLLGLVVSTLRPNGPVAWATLIHNRDTIAGVAQIEAVFAAVCARRQ